MLHNHQYSGCDHKLKFCNHCDTVYCTSCSKEWNNKYHNCFKVTTPSWPGIYYGIQNTLTATSAGNVLNGSLQADDHKHK